MKTEMGEYVVGAYLKIIKGCDFIDYNVRHPGGGLEGLNEIDVIGLDFHKKTVYLCEVTTHIIGAKYGTNKETVEKIEKKYADKHLSDFPERIFMFWSPVVHKGYVTTQLESLEGFKIIINEEYTHCIDELRENAKKLTHDVGNPFFRTLQILENLKR